MLSIISILVFVGPFLGEIYTSETVLLTARRFASTGTSYNLVSVCFGPCLSVTSRCSIKTDGRIELFFGMEASFHLSRTVL